MCGVAAFRTAGREGCLLDRWVECAAWCSVCMKLSDSPPPGGSLASPE